MECTRKPGRQLTFGRLAAYSQSQPMPHSSVSPPIMDGYPPGMDSAQYNPSDLGGQITQDLGPSSILQVTGDGTFSAIPSPVSSSQMHSAQTLRLPHRDPPTPRSPTDASSPISLIPTAYGSQLSTSPTTVVSALDSEAADSPLSEIRETRSISPAGSSAALNTTGEEPCSSRSGVNPDPTLHSPIITRSRSLEGASVGQSGMGPVRRGNSASERGKNAAGSIRVHRPAGIKWNQRTRWVSIHYCFVAAREMGRVQKCGNLLNEWLSMLTHLALYHVGVLTSTPSPAYSVGPAREEDQIWNDICE